MISAFRAASTLSWVKIKSGSIFLIFSKVSSDWAVFYNQFAGYVGIFCCITFICSFVYLHQRFRKENGLAVKSNEVLELDTASRNAITMA